MDDVDAVRRQRGSEGAIDAAVVLDPPGTRPAGLGHGREVDRAKVGGHDATGVRDLLVHPDRSVHRIVEDESGQPGTFAHGRLELGHEHGEAAIAGQRDDRSIRHRDRGADGRRQRVAHRARGRPEEATVPWDGQVAGGPATEVAGVGRQDGALGESRSQAADDRCGVDALRGWRQQGCPGGGVRGSGGCDIRGSAGVVHRSSCVDRRRSCVDPRSLDRVAQAGLS